MNGPKKPWLPLGLVVALAAAGCGARGPGPDSPDAKGDPVSDVEPEKLFRHAVALAQRGDQVRAEQYLVAAMNQGYPKDKALPMLMRVCLASSRLRAALGYAAPYLEKHPNDWALRYLVASIHMGLDQPKEAHEELEKVVSQAPDRPEPHYLLAVVLRDHLDKPGAAREHYARYVELAPDGEHASASRTALARIQKGDSQGAKATPQIDPDSEPSKPKTGKDTSGDESGPQDSPGASRDSSEGEASGTESRAPASPNTD